MLKDQKEWVQKRKENMIKLSEKDWVIQKK